MEDLCSVSSRLFGVGEDARDSWGRESMRGSLRKEVQWGRCETCPIFLGGVRSQRAVWSGRKARSGHPVPGGEVWVRWNMFVSDWREQSDEEYLSFT